jgi:hypothetical protein
VSPVKYELGSLIPEDGILHSHRRETSNLTLRVLTSLYAFFYFTDKKKHVFYLNRGQPRTLLQLKLVGILTINLFLT